MFALLFAIAAPIGIVTTLGVPIGGFVVVLDVAAVAALIGATIDLAIRRSRGSLRVLGLFAALALFGVGHLTLAPTAPSVILLVVDCLRADRLTAQTMPKTWALASSSTRFTTARSQSSWTRSAMPSLLSGRYPTEHGLYRTKPAPDRIHADIPMLAEQFSAEGWLTAAFVEQAQLDPVFGFGRGFGRYGFRDGLAVDINRKLRAWNTLFRTVPRFALVHYIDVHGPYKPHKRPKDLPKSSLATWPGSKWRDTIRAIRNGTIDPTEQDYAHLAALYDAEVRQMDRRLGELYAHLEASGTLDAGWLVVTADHGERFGEHGDVEHMNAPDEAVLSVPLVLRPPGGAARVVETLVQHVDLAPTLLAAAGLPVHSDMPGRDLFAPLLPAPSFAEEWYGRNHRVSAREGTWKLIRDPRVRLYDLATDPTERVNVAEANPAVVARLESLLAAYFAAAEAKKPIASVDWANVPIAVWTQGESTSEAVEASDETMEALEALGYLEE
jgi:arylsulfatase A-like enzyme